MRVLSPGEPFSEGQGDEGGIEKIMVVLTDGSNVFGNTQNALGSTYSSIGYLVDGRLGITGGGYSATTDLMNVKTLEACTNAKADGIEVYTIRLEEPNVATGTMLKECASARSLFRRAVAPAARRCLRQDQGRGSSASGSRPKSC